MKREPKAKLKKFPKKAAKSGEYVIPGRDVLLFIGSAIVGGFVTYKRLPKV